MKAPEFDPYLKWLGIRADRRPPNHYRLLGLELFESNPDVILHAADARIGHLQQFQSGAYRVWAERLLAELQAAKVTLLDPEKKAAYDEQLRAELGETLKEREPFPTSPSFGSPPQELHKSSRSHAWAHPIEEAAQAEAGQASWLIRSRIFWLSSCLVLLMLVLAGSLMAYLSRSGGLLSEVAWQQEADSELLVEKEASLSSQASLPPPGPKPGEEPCWPTGESENRAGGEARLEAEKAIPPTDSLQRSSSTSQPALPSESSTQPAQASHPSPEGTGPAEKESSGIASSGSGGSKGKGGRGAPGPGGETSGGGVLEKALPTGSEKEPSDKQSEAQPVEQKEPTQGESKEAAQEESGVPAKGGLPSGEKESSAKEVVSVQWSVPPAEEQKRAESVVRQLFQKELTEAKLPIQKLALADKLFYEAQTTKDDPAAAYVLFGWASGLAAAGGDLSKSIQIIEVAGTRFRMNVLRMKLEVLNKALVGLRTSAQPAMLAYELADLALTVMEEAILADQIDEAAEAYKLAASMAKRAGDPELSQEVFSLNHCLQVLEKHYEAFRAAEARLGSNPEDPAAQSTVGRWHCFFKGLWEKGLPALARGQPEELASLAQADLQSPTDPKAQFLLAERWLKYAEAESEESKGHIQLRAAYWYQQAVEGLSGLDKLTAQRQLEKLPTVPPLFTRRERGEVVPGNVALQIAGTQVIGPNAKGNYLIDGQTTEDSVAKATSPATWTIVLPKLYRLQEIRLLLLEPSKSRRRHYGYILAVSKDGKRFVPLVDRSKGQWTGWQVHRFPARPVRAIRLIGLRESGDRIFYAGELEAYCLAPGYPPGMPCEPPPGIVSGTSSEQPERQQKKSQDAEAPAQPPPPRQPDLFRKMKPSEAGRTPPAKLVPGRK